MNAMKRPIPIAIAFFSSSGAHDRLAKADEDGDDRGEALDHDQAHRLGETETVLGDEGEGDNGVEA